MLTTAIIVSAVPSLFANSSVHEPFRVYIRSYMDLIGPISRKQLLYVLRLISL